MFRRLRQVAARDGRNPRMNRHLNEVDNGRHAREERRRSGPRGAIKKVLPEHFLSEEAVGRRFTAGVSRRKSFSALHATSFIMQVTLLAALLTALSAYNRGSPAVRCDVSTLPSVYFLLTSTPDRASRLPRVFETQ